MKHDHSTIRSARAIAIAVSMLTLVSCQSVNLSKERVARYQSALAQTKGASLPAGSVREKEAIRRFQAFFTNVTPDSVARQARQVYAPDAYLDDTLKVIRGVDGIEAYLTETAGSVTEFKTTFQDVARSGNDYYFRWEMDFATPKLQDGDVIRTIGITQVRFNSRGQVVLHQDFWDATQGVFEHAPVVGGLVQALKRRF